MAKKPSPLKNRLARFQADKRSGVVAAALLPADESRSLAEVVWSVLSQDTALAVSDAAELAECLTDRPAFGSAEASGWVAGLLAGSLARPDTADPLANPTLRALDEEVIAALGPDAVWYASGDHPIPAFRTGRGSRGGWRPILDATFDRVVAARGNGLDLVVARVDED
jgi:hypothetical protein